MVNISSSFLKPAGPTPASKDSIALLWIKGNKKDYQCFQALAEGSQSLGSPPQSKHDSGNYYCYLFTATCMIRNPRSQSFADFEQQKNNLKYSLIVK